MRTLYFGCLEEKGHYLHMEDGSRKLQYNLLPWKKIDMDLCPESRKQGIGRLHHNDGWTALAFWDCSVDERPGSNSVFFADEVLDFEGMFQMIKYTFPNIMKRFEFPLKPEIANSESPTKPKPHNS